MHCLGTSLRLAQKELVFCEDKLEDPFDLRNVELLCEYVSCLAAVHPHLFLLQSLTSGPQHMCPSNILFDPFI